MNKLYDTTELKKMIANKGYKPSDFVKKVSELTGGNVHTTKGHVNGYGLINKDEIAAFAMLLELKENEANRLFVPVVPIGKSSKKEEKPEVHKKDNEADIIVADTPYIVSIVNLDRARVRCGLTQTQIMNAMKASGSDWVWGTVRVSKEDAEKLTKILNADFDAIFEYRPMQTSVNGSPSYLAGKNLDASVKKHGVSPEKIEKTIGAAKGTYSGWLSGKPVKDTHAVAVAKILGVRVSDVFVLASDKAAKPKANPSDDIAKSPELSSVKGMLQVFDVFGVINDNLQSMTDYMTSLDSKAAKRQDELNSSVKKDIAVLSSRLDSIEKSMSLILEKIEDVHKPDNTKIVQIDSKKSQLKRKMPAVSSEPVNSTFSLTDDFEHYVKKINSMAQHIASASGQTRDDVLHMFYTEMNRTYGVVYDQLKKEYKANHGTSQAWSMALLYDNTLFREIFFHIVQAMYEEVCTQKEICHEQQ